MLVLRCKRISTRTEPVQHIDLCIQAAFGIDQQDSYFRVELRLAAQEEFHLRFSNL